MSDADVIYQKLIEKIKEVRKEKKISQQDIAKHLGITQGAYSHMELGRNKFSSVALLSVLIYLEIDVFSTPKEDETPAIAINNPDDFVKYLQTNFATKNDLNKEVSNIESKLDKILEQLKKEKPAD